MIMTRALAILLVLSTQAGLSADHHAVDPPPLRWFKGNTHTHTLWSDGNDFPEMVIDWYHKRGYHFLALSDHNLLSVGQKWIETAVVEQRAPGRGALERYRKRFGDDWVELRERSGRKQVRLKTLEEVRKTFEKPDRFLMVPAEEITDAFSRKPVHINGINMEKALRPRKGSGIRDTIRNNMVAVKEQAEQTGRQIIAHVNHPNFGWGLTAEDLAHVREVELVEVYNGHPSINHLGDEIHAGDERMWDIANTLRIGSLRSPPIYGVATDDSHHYHGRGTATSGRGWIFVRAAELSADALVRAIRKGDFYGSSGVTLNDVRFDAKAGTLTVSVAPEEGVTYRVQFIGTKKGASTKSEPVVNPNGVELRVTRRYSDDVGAVLQETAGPHATYRFGDDELFVRALITSSRPHPNASYKGQVEQAWTQPVGFERWLQ